MHRPEAQNLIKNATDPEKLMTDIKELLLKIKNG
jgi:hypothetical protein